MRVFGDPGEIHKGHDHECPMAPAPVQEGTYLHTYSTKIKVDRDLRIRCEQRMPTELTHRLRPIQNVRTVFYLPDPPSKEDPLGNEGMPYVEILWDEVWDHTSCNW